MEYPIYLDYNATTPIDPEVAAAMRPYLGEYFGNPSSMHRYGIEARKAIEKARSQVAALLNCETNEVVFTSGGSESNNLAIKGIAFADRHKGDHIITSLIEHPAVTEVCHFLEKMGFRVTYLPVDHTGMVDLAELKRSITPKTILVSVMHANNEVGTIQPVRHIASICHEHNIPFHTDAAQSVGKITTDVEEMEVDLLSLAGHKFYAPKGVGALYVRSGLLLEKQIHGADHEQDRRAGTENLLEIVGLGKACEIALRDLEKNRSHLEKMRDMLSDGLAKKLDGFHLNGHPEIRLPNTLSIGFEGLDANTLLSELTGIAASAGAACHVGDAAASSVLMAMNVPMTFAPGTIRLSVGKYTTGEEIIKAVDVISETVHRLTSTESLTNVTLVTDNVIKLTQYTHGLGCACKLRPQELELILKELPLPNDRNVLVDIRTNDDAAVYKISDDIAIVQTVDFFTPVVDDPYSFGCIAAANALSDVYAMGAEPRFALNIVGFPSKRLPLEVLGSILKGAHDKATEAGISILGGHSIEDTEPKFGMAVTGFVHPDRILTNARANSGDVLILTKPIGLGILSTALKRGMLDNKQEIMIISVMSELNRTASQVMRNYPVSSCTDITGFGLLGHLKEMTEASGVEAEIYLPKVPVLDQAWEMARANMIPGGTLSNFDFVSNSVVFDHNISRTEKLMLCDAQTSGGLLIAVPEKHSAEIINELLREGIKSASLVGKITGNGQGTIRVRK
jgi:cysteine desulfurase NifS/selenium donor protein